MIEIHCDLCGDETDDPVEISYQQVRPPIYYANHLMPRVWMRPTIRLCSECADALEDAFFEMAEKKRKQVDK